MLKCSFLYASLFPYKSENIVRSLMARFSAVSQPFMMFKTAKRALYIFAKFLTAMKTPLIWITICRELVLQSIYGCSTSVQLVFYRAFRQFQNIRSLFCIVFLWLTNLVNFSILGEQIINFTAVFIVRVGLGLIYLPVQRPWDQHLHIVRISFYNTCSYIGYVKVDLDESKIYVSKTLFIE